MKRRRSGSSSFTRAGKRTRAPLTRPRARTARRGYIVGALPAATRVHSFVRTSWNQGFFTNGAAASGGLLDFKLFNVPNASDFTSLYDEYRIVKVEVEIIPAFTSANNLLGSNGYPRMHQIHSCVDYDGGNSGTTLASMMQYTNYKGSSIDRIHKRVIFPKIATEVFNTSVSTAYAPKWGQWIDTSNSSVPHYGMIYNIPVLPGLPQTGADSQIGDLKMKYFIEFRNVR